MWKQTRCTTQAKCVAWYAALLGAVALISSPARTLACRTSPPEPEWPVEWNITRSMWGADPEPKRISPFDPAVLPLRLVVVHHTGSVECNQFADCASAIRAMQRYFLTTFNYDLPYNFIVGNEGRVYEGRGWEGGVAAHTYGYNRCSLGISFMGDYRRAEGTSKATPLQLENTLKLLEGGVRDGMLHPRYVVVAARDLRPTTSPGDELYDALRQWPQFNIYPKRFRGRTCDEIYAELRAADDDPTSIKSSDSIIPLI